MTSADIAASQRPDLGQRLAFWVALAFVVVGMFNAMPGIPGVDALAKSMSGADWFRIRRFPYQYFYPIVFFVMMLIVALDNSMWRERRDSSPLRRRFGLFMDVALVVAAIVISLSYLNEIQSVCLADQVTGDRARLIADSLAIEKENASLLGLPEPSTVDDPKCLNSLGGALVAVVGLAVVVFLGYTVNVWGLPLVLVAIAVAGYTLLTILVWYFFGTDGINKYLVTKLGAEPRMLADGFNRVQDILTSNASGLLGRFMGIILNEVFPYLILGNLFGASAGGQSLIKLAFRWTRKLRGGPAHAAIVSSALFGTISGGPVVNVLSTGVLTIPMMLKRGFSKVFAGGVEAAASSGGSIMPPVMGVAAFVLASITAVPYSQVMIAAIIPAITYFVALFLTVVFQARKQNIEAIGALTEEMRLNRQDILNLVMIFLPILVILFLLLTTKDGVGCGILGTLTGAERTVIDGECRAGDLPWILQLLQNSAGDVGSAGWWAVVLLSGLIFLDPKMRAKPGRLVASLANAGLMISRLYLMFLAVSIIDFCLKMTGSPFYISLDVLQWLQSLDLGANGASLFQFLALFMTMVLAILLGMGMPAVPAYLNVALLMGPVLAGLGLSVFTAHMFIFYFAVASAITPPVAMAAYAAASITRAEPMATGFSAWRSGIVMFVIPFVFAMYPEILLVHHAVIDPSSQGSVVAYLPGYDGTIQIWALLELLPRLLLMLYLLASALVRFDWQRMQTWEVILRLGLAVGVIFQSPVVFIPACIVAVGWIIFRTLQNQNQVTTARQTPEQI